MDTVDLVDPVDEEVQTLLLRDVSAGGPANRKQLFFVPGGFPSRRATARVAPTKRIFRVCFVAVTSLNQCRI